MVWFQPQSHLQSTIAMEDQWYAHERQTTASESTMLYTSRDYYASCRAVSNIIIVDERPHNRSGRSCIAFPLRAVGDRSDSREWEESVYGPQLIASPKAPDSDQQDFSKVKKVRL